VFSCCFYLHVHTHCIAIVENVLFWTSTRTRFPSECVEILVPMILQHMLSIMSLALHFCWLACVSDMALLRISEKCVILNPPLHPTFTGWCEHLEYWPIFKVLIYDFRLWVSQHVSCTHLCSFQKPKKSVLLIFMFSNWRFWFVCHANVLTFVCHANFDGARTRC